MHWTNATSFPETATHAVDFDPGGLSGIGPLTARNFDGCGVRVIVVEDNSKCTAELIDSESVQQRGVVEQEVLAQPGED